MNKNKNLQLEFLKRFIDRDFPAPRHYVNSYQSSIFTFEKYKYLSIKKFLDTISYASRARIDANFLKDFLIEYKNIIKKDIDIIKVSKILGNDMINVSKRYFKFQIETKDFFLLFKDDSVRKYVEEVIKRKLKERND